MDNTEAIHLPFKGDPGCRVHRTGLLVDVTPYSDVTFDVVLTWIGCRGHLLTGLLVDVTPYYDASYDVVLTWIGCRGHLLTGLLVDVTPYYDATFDLALTWIDRLVRLPTPFRVGCFLHDLWRLTLALLAFILASAMLLIWLVAACFATSLRDLACVAGSFYFQCIQHLELQHCCKLAFAMHCHHSELRPSLCCVDVTLILHRWLLAVTFLPALLCDGVADRLLPGYLFWLALKLLW